MGRGLLVFKGDSPPKRKKSKKKHTSSSKTAGCVEQTSSSAPVASTSDRNSSSAAPAKAHTASSTVASASPPQHPQIEKGTGAITSSGTVITGHSTLFQKQLRAGDAILLTPHPTSSKDEMRVLTMILSNTSAAISTPFSSDVHSAAFNYIAKPRDLARERALKKQRGEEEKAEEERMAFGTYGNEGGQLVYREKTEHGGYRIRTERIDTNADRSDLLNQRAKRKSDKYC